MSFALDLLADLARFAARSALPHVRALHLPPASPKGERGEFCALELADGSTGLAFVLLGDTLAGLQGVGETAGTDPLALARLFAEGRGAERALGLAAINALTHCLFVRAGFEPPASSDSIGMLDPRRGEHVGMIGLFPPLVPRLLACGARLTVLELRAELVREHEGWRVTTDPGDLADCTKVLATGTLMLNDTLEPMLERLRGAERVALIGPSVGCLPDALFARGVTTLGGSWVTDAPAFIDALRQGRKTTESARKFSLAPADYPGLSALLDRL